MQHNRIGSPMTNFEQAYRLLFFSDLGLDANIWYELDGFSRSVLEATKCRFDAVCLRGNAINDADGALPPLFHPSIVHKCMRFLEP